MKISKTQMESGMFEKATQLDLLKKWVVVVFWLLLAYHFFRYAWVAEDAFINFRVAKNFLAGSGLTWNPGERVQVFTSALWMILTIAGAWISGEDIYSTLFLSFVLAMVTFWLLYRASKGSAVLFLAISTSLVCSNSIRDYLSSGLETPLLMCVTALYFSAVMRENPPSLRHMAFLASLAMLVRHDTILLTGPFLVKGIIQGSAPLRPRLFQAARDLLLGFLPMVAWTLFSLFYFGSAVPNTASAKIVAGFDAATQAVDYFAFIQHFDPLAYVFMISVLFVLYAYRAKCFAPALWAISLFVAYLFKVGADYMAGRFLVAPMIMAAFLLMGTLGPVVDKYFATYSGASRVIRVHASLIMFFGMVLMIRMLTVANSSQYHAARPAFVNGIVDERQAYYGSSDLETVLAMGVDHHFKDNASVLWKYRSEKLAITCHIGMVGYFGPPDVYIVDPLALSDRFLAGLTPRKDSRIGHFERPVPREYIESLLDGRNEFQNEGLRSYFEDIQLVTRGALMDPRRLGAIWRLSSGHYRKILSGFVASEAGGALQVPWARHGDAPRCMGGGTNIMVPDRSSGELRVKKIYLYGIESKKAANAPAS